ncbi:unnamed protein product, partial [Musa textilis]
EEQVRILDIEPKVRSIIDRRLRTSGIGPRRMVLRQGYRGCKGQPPIGQQAAREDDAPKKQVK